MSESYCVIIPADPNASLPETAEELRKALALVVGSERSRVKDYGKTQFIDAGGNWDGVACPSCGYMLTTPEWQAMMDRAWHNDAGFKLVEEKTACCQASTTVAELDYKWPIGFARWFVSAYDTTHGPLTEAETHALSKIAGLPLRAIYQNY